MISPQPPFNPEDWTGWARNLVRMLRAGGMWGAPDAMFLMKKVSNTEVTMLIGAPDARTAAVFRAAGIKINLLKGDTDAK